MKSVLTDDEKCELIDKHAPPIHPDFSDDDGFDELVDAIEQALIAKLSAAPAAQPMTDEQIYGLYRRAGLDVYHIRDDLRMRTYDRCINDFARAIESAATAPMLEQIAALTAQLDEAREQMSRQAANGVDAARYQWLRSQNWTENRLGVVLRPKDNVRLGSFLPSDTLLDETIDHMRSIGGAIAAQQPLTDVVRKALDRAFVMGQNYWADADSESYSANKRSDVTRQNFNAMRDEVCSQLDGIKEQPC